MSQQAPSMPQHAMAGQKPDFPSMPQHDDADKTRLFLASRVLGLLCNTTFFVSIKKVVGIFRGI